MTAAITGVLAALAAGTLSIAILYASIPRLRPSRRLNQLNATVGGRASRWAQAVSGVNTPWRKRKRAAVRRAVEAGCQEIIITWAEGLRAGESLFQAIQRSARSSNPPWSTLLGQALDRYLAGLSLPEALRPWEELESRPVRLVVRAVTIHQQAGGNLADALLRLAESLRQEDSLRRDMEARTAEARWTAYFVAATPFAMALYLLASAPDLLSPLLTHPAGRLALGYALFSWAAGLFSLRRLTRHEAMGK